MGRFIKPSIKKRNETWVGDDPSSTSTKSYFSDVFAEIEVIQRPDKLLFDMSTIIPVRQRPPPGQKSIGGYMVFEQAILAGSLRSHNCSISMEN